MTNQVINTSQTVIEDNISFETFLERYNAQPVEWHAGKVVKKVSNNPQHNFIVFFMAQLLSFFMADDKLGKVITDGVPMYISGDVPARQPDIMVLLTPNLNKITSTHVEGTADIVVEVVSPGSSTVDRGAKFTEYETAGVREYWLIDPIRKQVDIYALDDGGYYQRISKDEQLISHVLPNFALQNDILWQDDLPAGSDLLALVANMRT